jgi:hypothetical protein
MSAAYRIHVGVVVLLAVVLAGCQTTPQRGAPSAPPPTPAAPASGAQHQGRPFQIDGGASLLTILVYRGGPLARAGHNHVIASHDMEGEAFVPEDLSGVSFEVHVPVSLLTVDEEDLRVQAGADFPPGVPEEAKTGTKRNMLGAALLDGDRYPDIVLHSEVVRRSATGDGIEAQMRVIVRDQGYSVVVPLRYTLDGSTLEVTGEIPLKQTELGLTPFSLFGGALRVEDGIRVQFRIVAREGRPVPR